MITTNLEFSAKLKELGFPQDSMLSWAYDNAEKEWDLILTEELQEYPDDFPYSQNNIFSSPTAEEIIKQLPKFIKQKDDIYWFHISILKATDDGKEAEIWWAQYDGGGFDFTTRGDTILEAVELMYILLKRKEII